MNTLLIDVDSIRPDHLSPYNKEVDFTPGIQGLAEDSILFNKAYTTDSPSLPSRASVFTGRYGVNNGVITHGAKAQTLDSPEYWNSFQNNRKEWWSLPQLLYHKGIKTIGVSTEPRHPNPWIAKGFQNFIQPAGQKHFMEVEADQIVDQGIKQLEDLNEDFFMYLQFWDAHPPYSKNIEERLNSPIPDFISDNKIKEDRKMDTLNNASELGIKNRNDLYNALKRYDSNIRFVDKQLARLFTYLKQENLYNDTLIILYSDHGEEFGENGVYREHWSIFEPTQRIPLIVKPPADNPGSEKIDKLVSTVDIPKTVADYQNLVSPSNWQGRSLKPLIQGFNYNWRDSMLLSHGLYTAQRGVRRGKWKLVRTFHPGDWKDYLERIMLFNLEEDPWEQKDISKDNPELVSNLVEDMNRLVDRFIGRDGDPMKDLAKDGPPGSTPIYNNLDW